MSYIYNLSGQKLIKNAKNGQFGKFLKNWSLRSNSVTRQVSFNRTKIVGKCQNIKNSNATFRELFKQCVVEQWYIFVLLIHCDYMYPLIAGLPNELIMFWHQYPYLFGVIFCKFRSFASEMWVNFRQLAYKGHYFMSLFFKGLLRFGFDYRFLFGGTIFGHLPSFARILNGRFPQSCQSYQVCVYYPPPHSKESVNSGNILHCSKLDSTHSVLKKNKNVSFHFCCRKFFKPKKIREIEEKKIYFLNFFKFSLVWKIFGCRIFFAFFLREFYDMVWASVAR